MSKYKEIDVGKVKTFSIQNRDSKIGVEMLARPWVTGREFQSFWKSLPSVLASQNLRDLVQRIVQAFNSGKPVLLMMGAHVIKVGLSRIVIDLLEEGIVHGIAMNGSGAIHDIELSYFGETSENVVSLLKDGRFGMAEETANIMNKTVRDARGKALGFGEVLGERIVKERPAHFELSILGQAYRLEIPVTVHVALGTDVVHQHPSADGAAIGEMSLRDFRIWTHLVSQIGDGGVVLLFGSSVILPEVFIKALTVSRNVGGGVNNFTTANFDMIHHYRPRVNVVERPTKDGGQGYTFIGPHEIMLPLLAAAIKEGLV
jgi:hypothetical protein